MTSVGHLIVRGIVLFLFGMSFTFLLNLLQKDFKTKPFCTGWWLPLVFGFASAFVGLMYPLLEYKVGEAKLKPREWSCVLRCIAMFVGINEACIKIDFPSNFQLAVTLSVLSLGLWWYFDRTTVGFTIGLVIAAIATFITQLLVYHQIVAYTEKEFSHIQCWLPCIVFCGGITVGSIGKQLARNDFAEKEMKAHTE